ncbi:hypothetical protein QQM39_03090 [Streptomyces sp. DT2A-34]|uniref:hypothetical protein n=1 Tax=Streptomyces sp. DT2A-34 TaxID=3051182 RepID=UPI00265BF828|nr:hypothetical protein [Streptomyces sp. DT2A-34]MDO0909882.1 hypothetical protein [Streptomyces sp. DT2A-34]
MKTRESASEGYRQALAAHQAARPGRHVDAALAEAVERQTLAMRTLSARALSKTAAGTGEQAAPIEAARIQRRRRTAAIEADLTNPHSLCHQHRLTDARRGVESKRYATPPHRRSADAAVGLAPVRRP